MYLVRVEYFNVLYPWVDREKPPPPREVFYLLCSLSKNPEEEDPPRRICTRCFEGLYPWVDREKPRGESSSSGFLMREKRKKKGKTGVGWFFRSEWVSIRYQCWVRCMEKETRVFTDCTSKRTLFPSMSVEWIHFPRIRTFVEKRFTSIYRLYFETNFVPINVCGVDSFSPN